jgi:hypothetical protein
VVRSEVSERDVERRIKNERRKLHQNIIIFLNTKKNSHPSNWISCFLPSNRKSRLERS